MTYGACGVRDVATAVDAPVFPVDAARLAMAVCVVQYASRRNDPRRRGAAGASGASGAERLDWDCDLVCGAAVARRGGSARPIWTRYLVRPWSAI